MPLVENSSDSSQSSMSKPTTVGMCTSSETHSGLIQYTPQAYNRNNHNRTCGKTKKHCDCGDYRTTMDDSSTSHDIGYSHRGFNDNRHKIELELLRDRMRYDQLKKELNDTSVRIAQFELVSSAPVEFASPRQLTYTPNYPPPPPPLALPLVPPPIQTSCSTNKLHHCKQPSEPVYSLPNDVMCQMPNGEVYRLCDGQLLEMPLLHKIDTNTVAPKKKQTRKKSNNCIRKLKELQKKLDESLICSEKNKKTYEKLKSRSRKSSENRYISNNHSNISSKKRNAPKSKGILRKTTKIKKTCTKRFNSNNKKENPQGKRNRMKSKTDEDTYCGNNNVRITANDSMEILTKSLRNKVNKSFKIENDLVKNQCDDTPLTNCLQSPTTLAVSTLYETPSEKLRADCEKQTYPDGYDGLIDVDPRLKVNNPPKPTFLHRLFGIGNAQPTLE